MSLSSDQNSDSLYFSMDDPQELMARNSLHSFHLDDHHWPTVEHYYQAMKFSDAEQQQKIRNADSAIQAKKLGNAYFNKKRSDFKHLRTTLMTRAVYIQAKTHQSIEARILGTSNVRLIENSQFDYYWGCGRDLRGDNHYGQILMNVREKLNSETSC